MFDVWKITQSVDDAPATVSFETAPERFVNYVFDNMMSASGAYSLTLEKVSADEVEGV